MNVSLLIRNENNSTGIARCENEIVQRMKNFDDIKIINIKDYSIPPKIVKYLNFICSFLMKKNIIKNNNILHMLDQQLAIMLNFLNPKDKIVVTVYDMYSFIPEYKKTYSLLKRFQYFLVNRGLNRADYFITISHFVKKQIQEYLRVSDDRIYIMSLGIDHSMFKKININKTELFKKHNIPINKKIILYVGAEKPQKNFEGLIHAFDMLRNARNDVILVKIGSAQDKKMRDYHINLINRLNLTNFIYFTKFIPDSELVAFYNAADVFVMPSVDESGFDLPIVEAMACGCPIIFCDKSLKETVGDAGVLVEPDPKKISNAIIEVINNKKLNDDLKKKSINQAKLFNWNYSSKQLYRIYEKICEKTNSSPQ